MDFHRTVLEAHTPQNRAPERVPEAPDKDGYFKKQPFDSRGSMLSFIFGSTVIESK